MAAFIELLLATAVLPFLFHATGPQVAADKTWIDRDKMFCEHLDCTRVATYKREKFCNPCDTRHYCECIETKESLPYLRACAGSADCQTSDRLGACQKTMADDKCQLIDKVYMED